VQDRSSHKPLHHFAAVVALAVRDRQTPDVRYSKVSGVPLAHLLAINQHALTGLNNLITVFKHKRFNSGHSHSHQHEPNRAMPTQPATIEE
jgi:hypothetical protein|tara:strand:+ start:160 stop:432 length:273 start_codon:yes stop_codon:yes gene_type:complete